MKAIIINTEQIRNCETRAYNPSEWDRAIDRFLKFKDVKFYHVPKGDGYDYDRYYAEYLLPEGIRLFNSVSYSSTLCNGGFGRVDMFNITEDGKTFSDLVKLAEQEKWEEVKELGTRLAESRLLDIVLATSTLRKAKRFYSEPPLRQEGK